MSFHTATGTCNSCRLNKTKERQSEYVRTEFLCTYKTTRSFVVFGHVRPSLFRQLIKRACGNKLGWWITADTELYVRAKRWWSWARLTHSPRTLHSFLKRKRSGVPFRGIPLRDSIIRPIPNCAIPLPAQGSKILNSAMKKERYIIDVHVYVLFHACTHCSIIYIQSIKE